MTNIIYQSDRIAKYFSRNRIAWNHFYESERAIIDGLSIDSATRVLDIGCGCAGLGLALHERFGVTRYTGVELNALAASTAREVNSMAELFCGDILALSSTTLSSRTFDVVFSLSCVDWNIEFGAMFDTAWRHVGPQGHLVATFRLTDQQGCSDFTRSFQYINYDGVRDGECANYVVVNASDLMRRFQEWQPAQIKAYGYWGKPSTTAITPYERLCFAAFAVQRGSDLEGKTPKWNLDLPKEILSSIDFLR
jgi:SAM-dependent methyltransferase